MLQMNFKKGRSGREILHITPHLGGGVGNIISKITTVGDSGFSHSVILLEEPVDTHFVNILYESGIKVSIRPDSAETEEMIAGSDILILHWWHHPKTSAFLYDFPRIPVRFVIWSHISNLTVPSMHPDFISRASRVLFTTEASYEAYGTLDKELLSAKTSVVPGCGGINPDTIPEHREHDGFNIGYLGFVDFSKLHSDFINFCKAVNIPEARFIMAGNSPAREVLEKQAEDAGLDNPLIFLGYITDINSMLAELDVFGYPLMPMHTCTTENAILEAMAAEVPPVLMNQLTERYIVSDGITGLLVSNADEYGRAVRYLYENPLQRKRIGKNAREYVLNRYSFTRVRDAFYENMELVISEPKQYACFSDIIGQTPAEWFMSCLGTQKDLFYRSYLSFSAGKPEGSDTEILRCSPLLKMKKKSSVLHYADEFRNDPVLKKWADVIRKEGIRAEN